LVILLQRTVSEKTQYRKSHKS